jgi:hypothetical protein
MSGYRRLLALFAGVVVAGAAAPARAEVTSVAVLGIEPIDVPEALAQQLTDALRQRASSTNGVRMVQGKDLIEIKMIFSCDGETPACLANAGKSLGADKLLYGTIKKGPGKGTQQVIVALKLLDVKSAAVEKFVNETIVKRELAAGSVNASADKWFGALVEVDAKPTLLVDSEPQGGVVSVDGQAVGRTPQTLRELSAGTHTISVSMNGRVTTNNTVELRPGTRHNLVVKLDEVPSAPPPYTPPPEPVVAPSPMQPSAQQPQPSAQRGHPGRPAKAVALAAVGAAVVAGAVAIYTWRTYTSLEDTARADLMMSKPASPSDADTAFFKSPGCTPPNDLTSPNIQTYKSDCKKGETFANATTALWVVTGALAASGVISYVIGDRQAAAAARERSTAQVIKQSLRIAPVFSTQGGALTAAFEF